MGQPRRDRRLRQRPVHQGAQGAARHGPDASGQEREREEGAGQEGHGGRLGFAQRQAAARRIAGGRWLARICRSIASSPGKEITFVGSMVPTYSGRPWRSPASNQKIPYRFNGGKPQAPRNGAYLFRPES